MTDNPGTGGGKIRSRRAVSSRKPYSRASAQRPSFFSKVTDSFMSILNPITPRWLSNLSRRSESSTQTTRWPESERPSTSRSDGESPNKVNNNFAQSNQLSRPPLRNYQTSPSSNQNFVTPPATPEETKPKKVVSSQETGKEGLLKHLDMVAKRAKMDTDSPLPNDSSFLRKEMNLLSTNDNVSVASSSGRSSSVRMGSQKNDLSDSESVTKPFWNSSLDSQTPSSSKQQPTMTSKKRPRFNPAVFGMPSLGVTPSDNPFGSSFYEGPVQFGGANAGRTPYFATPYKIPSVTKVKVRHINQQRTKNTSSLSSNSLRIANDESMSSTAKKILQTLEKMSSPLNDARKIPSVRAPSTIVAERSRRRTQHSLNNSLAPPTSALASPSAAKLRRRTRLPANNSLLARKSKVQTEKEIITTPKEDSPNQEIPDHRVISARGLPGPIASLSSSASIPRSSAPSFGSSSAGGGGKMKRKTNVAHYSSLQQEEELEQPDLPNIPLPVTTLPSFNFAKKGMTSTPAVRTDKPAKQPEFNFASPVTKTTVSAKVVPDSDAPSFQFSSPPSKSFLNTSQSDTSALQPPKNFTSGNKSSPLMFAPDPKVVSAMKANKRKSSPLTSPESAGVGMMNSLKKGSVLDILGGKSSKPDTKDKNDEVKQPSLQTLFKKQSSGWTCEVCMVDNDAGDASCAACTTPKPNASKKPLQTITAPKAQNDKGWECGTCLVPNDASADKCVACTTPRPGASSASTNSFKPTDFSKNAFLGGSKNTFSGGFSFGVPAKSDSSNSVGNTASSEGTFKSKQDAESKPSFKFGVQSTKTTESSSPAPTFKFGAPSKKSDETKSESTGWGDLVKKQSSSWECEVCMVPNSDERKTCEACDSPKPGTKKTLNSSFKFGENSSGLFKFGVAKSADSSDKKPDKQVDAPATTSTTKEEPANPSFSFGVPASKSLSSETVKLSKAADAGTEKKPEAPSFNFGVKSTSVAMPTAPEKKDSAETKPKTIGFTFGPPKTVNPDHVAAPSALDTKPKEAFSFGIKPASTKSESPKPTAPIASSASSNPIFGDSQLSSGAALAPAFGAGEKKTAALPQFQFGAKPKTAQDDEKRPENAAAAAPNLAFHLKPAGSGGLSKDLNTSSSQSSTISAFGFTGSKPDGSKKSTPFGTPSGSTASPVFGGFGSTKLGTTDASKPEPAKPAAPMFAGFGEKKPQSTEVTKNEPAKPVFHGFNFGSSDQKKPATGGVFGSGSNSIPTTNPPPFGASVAANPLFSSVSTTETVFGKSSASTNTFSGGSSNSPFGTPSATGNIFGNTTSEQKGAFGQTKPQTAAAPISGFNFGSSVGDSGNKPGGFSFGNTQGKPDTGFQFGAGNQESSAAQPSAGFNFGASTAAPAKPAFNAAPTGGFAFGGAAPTTGQGGGVFQFGAGSNNNTQQQAGSNDKVFVFGGASDASANTNAAAGFNFSGSANSNFNFSAGPAPGAGPNAFNMGAPANPFNAGRTTPQSSALGGQRRFRQARRKLKK